MRCTHQKITDDRFGKSSKASRPVKPNDGTNTIVCNYCKKPGHKWRECRIKKADDDRKRKFATTKSYNNDKQVNNNHKMTKDNEKNKDSGAFVAKSRYGTFTSSEHSWVVYSGATLAKRNFFLKTSYYLKNYS